jgi:uncharacterized protein (TIGR00251 family)
MLTIKLYVQPGAKRTEIAGVHDGMTKIRIAAPPVDGLANETLIAFLAKVCGLRANQIEIRAGDRSRIKTIAFDVSPDRERAIAEALKAASP